MGYRIERHKPHAQRRTVEDLTTPVKLFVSNGTITEFAFPCWYQEVHPPVPAELHDRKLHDHHGWPNPRHADHICQLWIPEEGHCIHGFQECHPHCKHYINYDKVSPIHLLSEYEGYDPSVEIAWVDEHEGISITGTIDEHEDWVIRLHTDVSDPNATEERKEYRFSVLVNYERDGKVGRDLAVLAKLVVMPAACNS